MLPELRVVKNHIILPVTDPVAFSASFPHLKVASMNGQYVAAVPHDLNSARFLRNKGYNVPSLLDSYVWPGRYKPYEHQKVTTDFLIANPRGYVLSGMGCISGDAIISTNRRGNTRKIALRDLYERWTNVAKRPWSLGNSEWKCRSLKDGRFGLNQIEDVVFRGMQQTIRITTENGKTITCTPDHHMAQPDGSWIDAGSLSVGDYLVTNGKKRLLVPCPKCGVPKQSKIVSIEGGGLQDVYDICMAKPHHNFVANGIVVHNSGKTAAALWATDFLMRHGEVKKTLIVAPLSTLDRVWAQEIFHVLPHRRAHILHGSRDKRLALLKDGKADFYIINHDGIEIIADALAKRPDINHIIVDELAGYYRNSRTKRFRTMFQLLNRQGIPRSAWGLTGTPTPNAPTDCFGQIRLLTPERYTHSFKALQNELMTQVSQFKWVPKHGAEKRVNELMQPSIRYALEDCIDLPPTIYQERECPLSPQQAKHYKEMEKQCFTEIAGQPVSAVNAGVLISKLLQASVCGMYDGTGNMVDLDFSPRLAVLKEVIEECNEKIIIFVPFTMALNRFYDALKNDWTVEVVDGSVTSTKRNRIFRSFQEDVDPRIILAHPGTMAHGLTLTAATTIVWASPTTSTETFLQANARISRPGQIHTAHIVMLWGSKVECRLYQTLKDRRKLQELVLELAREKR